METLKINYIKLLKRANDIAKISVKDGNTPFGSILVDSEGKILVQSGNVEITQGISTGHAELKVCEIASKNYSREFLKTSTLITTVEPCAMCAGAIYWTGIGNVVYGIEERELKLLTGNDARNPTMSLDCRKVLNSGQKEINIYGPFEEVKDEIIQVHKMYWK